MGCLVFPRRLTAALVATAPPVVGKLWEEERLRGPPGRMGPVDVDPAPVRDPALALAALTFAVTLAEPGICEWIGDNN